MNAQEIIKNIFNIYNQYDIPPTLQKHMLDVAAVGKFISSKLDNTNTNNIVAALLLHDIANIIKFKFDEELAHSFNLDNNKWKNIQKEFIEKYGNSCSIATTKILEELNIEPHIIFLVQTASFENAQNILDSTNFELKVCLYSDYRVAPRGVVSLKERFKDLKNRYHNNACFNFDEKESKILNNKYFEIEKQIFSKINLQPEDITDSSIQEFLVQS